MTMISNYYAQVGVQIRRDSIQKVDRYLNNIHKRMRNFQRRVGRMSTIRFTARLDSARTMARLQRDMSNLGRNLRVDIRNISLSRESLNRSLQQMFGGQQQALQLNARISQQSLERMRDQVRNSLSNISISPTMNARVSRGSYGSTAAAAAAGAAAGARTGHKWAGDKTKRMSPTSGRRFNPWYNPMMIGGGLGAFMRYGVYSLPFMAGTMGAISIARRAEDIQSAYRVLDVASGSPIAGAGQMRFLQDLGDRLGFVGRDVAPQYSRLMLAARGSSLEENLQDHFANFMSYSAVTGSDPDTINTMIRRILSSRMITKSDLDQLSTAGFSNIYQLMADAITGGDVEKLREEIKGSGLDAEKVLPKLFNIMGRESDKFISSYYKSIERHRGRAAQATEVWWQNFMGGGVEEAMTDFYRTWTFLSEKSHDGARQFGGYLAGIVYQFNALLLAANDLWDYVRLDAKEGNIWAQWFGDPEDNKIVNHFNKIRSSFSGLLTNMRALWDEHGGSILGIFREMAESVSKVSVSLFRAAEIGTAFLSGGVQKALWTTAKHEAEDEGYLDEFLANRPGYKTNLEAEKATSKILSASEGQNKAVSLVASLAERGIYEPLGLTSIVGDEESGYRWSFPRMKGGWGTEGYTGESLRNVSRFLTHPDMSIVNHPSYAHLGLATDREYDPDALGRGAEKVLKSMENYIDSRLSPYREGPVDLNVIVSGSISHDGDVVNVEGLNARILGTVGDEISRTLFPTQYPNNQPQ